MPDENRYTISDALLPLLDVALLLMGFFIVVFAVAASSHERQDPGATSESVGLPSNVLVVRIEADAGIVMREGEAQLHLDNADELRKRLRQLRDHSETVVLLTIDDPWSRDANEVYRKCKGAIQDAGVRYARIY